MWINSNHLNNLVNNFSKQQHAAMFLRAIYFEIKSIAVKIILEKMLTLQYVLGNCDRS